MFINSPTGSMFIGKYTGGIPVSGSDNISRYATGSEGQIIDLGFTTLDGDGNQILITTGDGIFVDSKNYWYTSGHFKIGDTNNFINWNTSNLTISGTFDGNVVATGNISGSSLSTGSFGVIEVGGGHFTSASLAAGGSGGGGGDVVSDTSPQLGGTLDLNSNDVIGTGNLNIIGNVSASSNSTGSFGRLNVATSAFIEQTGSMRRLMVKRIAPHIDDLEDEPGNLIDFGQSLVIQANTNLNLQNDDTNGGKIVVSSDSVTVERGLLVKSRH